MKTTNTMNTMNNNSNMEKLNQLKALAARRNAKLVCVEELRDNRNDEVLSRVYDGTIELKQLLNIKEECIDMTKCERPIQVIQKIYAAGSEVGTTTTRGQNEYMIDVTTDEGFEAFKNAILELYNDREKAVQLGKNGRQFIMENLTREIGTSKYVEVVKKVFEEKCNKK